MNRYLTKSKNNKKTLTENFQIIQVTKLAIVLYTVSSGADLVSSADSLPILEEVGSREQMRSCS